MELFVDIFAAHQLRMILFDDLVRSPHSIIGEIVPWLGVSGTSDSPVCRATNGTIEGAFGLLAGCDDRRASFRRPVARCREAPDARPPAA
jgi:hypothetical protein